MAVSTVPKSSANTKCILKDTFHSPVAINKFVIVPEVCLDSGLGNRWVGQHLHHQKLLTHTPAIQSWLLPGTRGDPGPIEAAYGGAVGLRISS